jgi:hypothetical protein
MPTERGPQSSSPSGRAGARGRIHLVPDAPTDPVRDAEPGSAAEPAHDAAEPARDIVRDTRSDDDRDIGWGDDLDDADRGRRDARWYEEQRPPHWE